MKRTCGTPGCIFKDFHIGPCSNEAVEEPRRVCCPSPVPVSPTRSENQFQHGTEFFAAAVRDQVGVVVGLPPDLNGGQRGCGLIIGASTTLVGFELVVVGVGRKEIGVEDMLRHDVVVTWRHPSEGTLSLHDRAFRGSYEKYHTSAARRVKCLVKTLRDTYRCRDTDLFVSLDGKGANHDVFHRAYEGAAPGATPRFVIFEKDPLVACNQKMLYNDGVIYTGAMKKEGFGFVGKAPPGIEYLISTRNANGVTNVLFTQEDCDSTVALYLDYCGGIMGGGLDFDRGQRILTKLVSRLPRLAVLAITFGKRRHDGLSSDFERYAPTPHGFGVAKTFDDEKVVCRVFQRLFNIPRTLAVPGKHWVYGTDKAKSAQTRLSKHACVIQKLEHGKGDACDVFVHAVEPGGGTWEGKLSWKLSDARRLIRKYNQRDQKALAKGTDKFKHKARRAIIANYTAQLSMIDEFWVA